MKVEAEKIEWEKEVELMERYIYRFFLEIAMMEFEVIVYSN